MFKESHKVRQEKKKIEVTVTAEMGLEILVEF